MKTGSRLYPVKYKGESLVLVHMSNIYAHFIRHFITASYDGNIRSFDFSQKLTNSTQVHSAPISSLSIVTTTEDLDTYLLATSSHDLSARLTKFSVTKSDSQPIASLHLHTAPLSSISSSHTGSHLLTSSWDGLIGLWDTTIPTADEVPLDQVETNDRKKRCKVVTESEKAKRKAPVTVLKGHTARVSKVVFGKEDSKVAYSSGFDSTVRTWDLENGICTNIIVGFTSLHDIPGSSSLLLVHIDRR